MKVTDPFGLVQAGAGDGDVSHGHVEHGLLCSGNTSLLLQTEQHHQGADHPAAKLQTQRHRGRGTEMIPHGWMHTLSVCLYTDTKCLVPMSSVYL